MLILVYPLSSYTVVAQAEITGTVMEGRSINMVAILIS
jgi:hypothetical protein